MKISKGWEDCGFAYIHYLDCDCTTRIIENKDVLSGDEVECSKCHKKYRFVWGGMQVIQIEERQDNNLVF